MAIVVVLGLVAFAVTQGDEDEPDQSTPEGTESTSVAGTASPSTLSPEEVEQDAARVELVLAVRPMIDAITAEATASVLTITGSGDVAGGYGDIPTARAETDAAQATFEAVVNDATAADVVGDEFAVVMTTLGLLDTMRANVDAIEPGSDPTAGGQVYDVERSYRDVWVSLIDAADPVALSVVDPVGQLGARLLVSGLRGAYLTSALLGELSAASSASSTLDTPEAIAQIAELWSTYSATLTGIQSDAAGSDYEPAAESLDEQLTTTGHLATVPDILAGGTIDFSVLYDSTTPGPGGGWPGFITETERLLTSS